MVIQQLRNVTIYLVFMFQRLCHRDNRDQVFILQIRSGCYLASFLHIT